jgi:predicted RNA-binding protein with TRAM domain
MKKLDLKKLVVGLAIMSMMCVASGHDLYAQETGNGTETNVSENESIGTLVYKGATYNVRIGEIGKDKDGRTTVEITGGFKISVADFTNTNLIFAGLSKLAKSKITTVSKTVDATSYAIPEGGMSIGAGEGGGFVATLNRVVYSFPVSEKPAKIIIYNDDGGSVTFDWETKRVEK